eukprot:g38779.t1
MVVWISNNDESEYRKEIEGSVIWCNENNLSFNFGKTKELAIDFGKKGGEHALIYINRAEVERVDSIKFLRVMITDNLFWTSNIDVRVRKARQRLFILRQLRKFDMSIKTLTNFYGCTNESILSRCTMAWYGNCSAQDRKKLQKVVCTAQIITEANLLSMDSNTQRGKTANIIKDPSHPELVKHLSQAQRFAYDPNAQGKEIAVFTLSGLHAPVVKLSFISEMILCIYWLETTDRGFKKSDSS